MMRSESTQLVRSKETDHETSGDDAHSSFRSTRQRWGIARALFASVMGHAERAFGLHVYRIRARPLVEANLPPLPEGWSVRQVSWRELHALARDPALALKGEFLNSTAARWATMTAVFDHERLVSYAFAIAGSGPAGDDMWVKCSPPYRYSFKSFTRPESRGRRLSTYASLGSDRFFLRGGCTHAISYAATYNFASIRTEASKGNVFIGIAGYLKLGNLRVTFRSPGCRHAGFEFRYVPRRDVVPDGTWPA